MLKPLLLGWESISTGEPQSLLMRGCPCLAVIKSPPGWEVGVYTAGALALLGIAAVSLWKLWTSGSFPNPSPFPNYDYRYLQQKYGETYAEAKQKVRFPLSRDRIPLPPQSLVLSWLTSSGDQGPLSHSVSPPQPSGAKPEDT